MIPRCPGPGRGGRQVRFLPGIDSEAATLLHLETSAEHDNRCTEGNLAGLAHLNRSGVDGYGCTAEESLIVNFANQYHFSADALITAEGNIGSVVVSRVGISER